MAFDRQGTGLTIIRISLGVFFVFEGLMKYRWFINSSILAGRFQAWIEASSPGSVSRWYLDHVAVPGLSVFARLVPLGEFVCGVALVLGIWTSLFALVVLFMTINYHVASGELFRADFLTSGTGLPVVGAALGLMVGARRLPWSIRG